MLFDEINGDPTLPRTVIPKAPPLKIQGIKTKIVPFIASSISWEQRGRWIEPFVGSAAVTLNIAPPRALLADTNEHVINFYRGIQDGSINGAVVRRYLEREGKNLLDEGADYYYEIRKRFNDYGESLDFLFLNRSCFNGMVRFNRRGEFNVPFCKKPNRFRPALISKIVNQIEWSSNVMEGKEWDFVVQDWRNAVEIATADDMIYCDPPYIGRHTDYYNGFTGEEACTLARALLATPAKFAMSMWLENKYRTNDFVEQWFSDFPRQKVSHFYHLGSTEKLRNQMTEVVIVSKNAFVETLN